MPFNTPVWNRLRYTLYAPVYDRFVSRVGLLRRGRGRAIQLADLRSGERVLILAAGTGLDLPLLPRGVEVVATDISPAMVRRIEARAGALGIPVRAEVMDAARVAYPDGEFDCVLLHLALAVVPDPVATLREAERVLRPGGRVSVFDKFLPEGVGPSLARRALNVVASLVATDINRRLSTLIEATDLVVTRREVVGLGGNLVVGRAEKPPGRGGDALVR